jgi:cation diffusion facilitator family transporter
MITTQENFRIQKWLTGLIVLLFIIKIIAWYLTNSVAILTDALEYTINVISGFIGLYSLYISAKPKDKNHPYGHGKIEFLSATVEGTLMIVSCFVILYEAINNLKHPHELQQLDFGIYLVGLTGLVNYYAGHLSIKNGKKNNSLALIATGKHMQSDTYATLGIILGLILIHFTHYVWIDSVVAFVFAMIIIVAGYKIIRSSIAGIMDEADDELLDKVVALCQSQRKENWVDIHNLRIIKYGGTLHLDCHFTIPWYFNIHEGHAEVDALSKLVKDNFGDSLELFVHTDGCLDFSCKICNKADCAERIHTFEKRITWNIENISTNSKHTLEGTII